MTNAYGRPTITSELGRSSDVAVERNSYSRGTRSNWYVWRMRRGSIRKRRGTRSAPTD